MAGSSCQIHLCVGDHGFAHQCPYQDCQALEGLALPFLWCRWSLGYHQFDFLVCAGTQPHLVLELWSNVIPIGENTSNHKLQRRLDTSIYCISSFFIQIDTSIILNPNWVLFGYLCWVLLFFMHIPGLLPGGTTQRSWTNSFDPLHQPFKVGPPNGLSCFRCANLTSELYHVNYSYIYSMNHIC